MPSNQQRRIYHARNQVSMFDYNYLNSYMASPSKKNALNQYSVREDEVQQIREGRFTQSEQQADWFYEKQVKEISSRNKYKYQDVVSSHKIGFLDDMKQLIFDPKRSTQDQDLFEIDTKWKLTGFEEQQIAVKDVIPSLGFLRKLGMAGEQLNEIWGRVQLQGKVNVKINQTSYQSRVFNLRKRAFLLYPPVEEVQQDKQQLIIHFTETTFNYQSENDQYFSLKFGEKILKIKKDNESRQVLKAIQRCLFLCSFRGAFCLRNEVPSYNVEDYVVKEVDTIKGIDFVHENKHKEIVGSRYYREAIGGFFYLLNKQSFKRKTFSLEITLPKWLKPHFSSIPNCDLNAVTNVVPTKNPLMNLKVKLNQSEIALLNQNLKYIFPFRKEYAKRSLVVYESNLQDNQVSYMMKQISYPMYMIGVPKNHLSILGLEYVVNAAGTLYHETIDFSYNSKLINISGTKIFTLTNANPSIKKVTLKGCYVLLGEEDEFFQGLASNMCLKQFQIDYMDSYNDAMIKHLSNYDAEMY